MSAAWIAEIRAGSYQVHGDLDELMPEAVGRDVPPPDEVTDAEMLSGLPDVVAEMLLRTRDLRVEMAGLAEQNRELVAERDRLAEQVAELSADRPGWPRRLLSRRAPGAR